MPPAASALCIAARVVVDDAERDPHSTVERALPLVADARTVGDDRALALVLRAVGIAQRLLGDIASSSERLDEAVVCSQRVGDPNLEADVLTSRAGNLFLTGAIDACDSDLARAIEIASGDSLAYALFQRATIANRRGEHDTVWVRPGAGTRSPERHDQVRGSHPRQPCPLLRLRRRPHRCRCRSRDRRRALRTTRPDLVRRCHHAQPRLPRHAAR